MYKEFKALNKEFEKISKKGYIKSINNSCCGIGLTFEKELNIPKNEFSVPDYNGIEIKTKNESSKRNISLFSAVPDGEELFEIERLRNKYGYPFHKDKNLKILRFETSGKYWSINRQYKFKLQINKEEKKVFLCILNKYNDPMEKKVYWSFDYLENKLYLKLKYLAFVKAERKRINRWNFFHYKNIKFYKLKSFDAFLDLLENGKITLNFNVGVHIDKKRYGKTDNHGCAFKIYEEDLNLLYDEFILK